MSLIDKAKSVGKTAQIVGTIASSVTGQPQTPIQQAAQYQKTQLTQKELRITNNPTISGKK